MGGKIWSEKEEQVFWTVVVPQSPHAANPDSRALSWAECVTLMKQTMAGDARREYTQTMLYEHHYQNTRTGHKSPRAVRFIGKYLEDVAYYENLNSSSPDASASRSALTTPVSSPAASPPADEAPIPTASSLACARNEIRFIMNRDPGPVSSYEQPTRSMVYHDDFDPALGRVQERSETSDFEHSMPRRAGYSTAQPEMSPFTPNPWPNVSGTRHIKIRRRYPGSENQPPGQDAAYGSVPNRKEASSPALSTRFPPESPQLRHLSAFEPCRSPLQSRAGFREYAPPQGYRSPADFPTKADHVLDNLLGTTARLGPRYGLPPIQTRTPLPTESSKRKHSLAIEQDEMQRPAKRANRDVDYHESGRIAAGSMNHTPNPTQS